MGTAIFEVDLSLVVAGLKAISALPQDAECVPHADLAKVLPLVLKVSSDRLPTVPDGEKYQRRIATRGNGPGLVKKE